VPVVARRARPGPPELVSFWTPPPSPLRPI
jgi:hypothetical protein